MEKFYLEEPSLERKNDAIDYIEEHIKYSADSNGTNGLVHAYLNYEDWLKVVNDRKSKATCPAKLCPAYSYFFVRSNDNKIIGMVTIRYDVPEAVLVYAGNIGYGIRPLERGKGYSKINLYLALEKCKEMGLSNVIITASDNNPASYKTIISLGGVLENKLLDYEDNSQLGRYRIDVNKSLEDYYDIYNIAHIKNQKGL